MHILTIVWLCLSLCLDVYTTVVLTLSLKPGLTYIISRFVFFLQAILCAGLFPNAVKVGLGLESKGRGGKKRVRVAFRTK